MLRDFVKNPDRCLIPRKRFDIRNSLHDPRVKLADSLGSTIVSQINHSVDLQLNFLNIAIQVDRLCMNLLDALYFGQPSP